MMRVLAVVAILGLAQWAAAGNAGSGWGNGDTFWGCSERYGNCTDFHALFISLTPSEGIPARIEIGFPVPTDRAGPAPGFTPPGRAAKLAHLSLYGSR